MKNFLTLITVAAMAFAAHANILTVAEGTDEAEYVPFYGYQMDAPSAISQVIYPADMLADMNGGTITEIKFYPTAAFGALGSGNLQISLKEVEQVGYTSTTLLTDATVVGYAYPVQGETEWTIVFDEPFEYHGGNLMIETSLIQTGSYKSTKFFGQSFSYAVGIAQYKYSWGNEYYYESEHVLPMATFTYEGGGSQDEGITLLSEANALEDAAEFTFNGDAVVTACKNGYVFLRDESGYGMIAGVTGAAFENGQVLGQGWTATKTSVNSGWVRYTNAAGLSYSGENNAELAAPQELMTKPTDDSMLNAYVLIRNTTISSGGGGGFPGFPGHAVQYTLPDGTTIGETQTLWSFDGEAGSDLYNVYGIVCKVSGTYKIQPVIFEKIEEPQPTVERGNVNGIGGVDMDDLTALINYMLDPVNTEINQANAAACNSLDSNEVNMDDLTALINFMMTGAWAN